MAIIDPLPPAGPPTVTDGANRIRRRFINIVNNMDHGLKNIRAIVNNFGRANLVTELGADAAAMLTLYTTMKDVLESAEVGLVVDPLPS
jgi:hypothetical protein